jgi:hypothetical protein
MSYKPEVIADSSGKWSSNACRFGSLVEASEYVNDLMFRWTMVTDTRVVESDDPVCCRWVNGKVDWLEVPKP